MSRSCEGGTSRESRAGRKTKKPEEGGRIYEMRWGGSIEAVVLRDASIATELVCEGPATVTRPSISFKSLPF